MKMGDTEETYCRLCAEPTPLEQLISPNEDVAISSKIAAKMLWINIDISSDNPLPATICFSCFDLLERTWNFLHNVRSAQEKLAEIFCKIHGETTEEDSSVMKSEVPLDAGKPVDKNWQEFQSPKLEIKSDPDPEENSDAITLIDPKALLGIIPIKTEQDSENHFNGNDTDGFNTTDSDLPLQASVKKKKKGKKKKKIKYDLEMTEDMLTTDIEAKPLSITELNLTWEDYMCRCASCDALCKNISSLRLHSIQIHERCCSFKCPDCGRVIGNFKAFANHVRIHKAALRYCCEYCNKQFTLPRCVKKHLISAHADSALMTCQNCGTYFDDEESLQDHLVMYSKESKKGRRKDKTKDKLDVELKCGICGKEFKSRSNLIQHKLVHTERSRDFSCHVCGKMFFTKGTLSTHMITHEDTKPYKCEFCALAFRARGNLQSHISLHSDVKPFVCEQCGKSFRVKRHLKSHSIVHTDLMPYVCQYCNKPFRFKTRLNLHLRQHTGAKPYTCPFCQRDFTNGSNYKKHMKRRHNIDTSKKKMIERNKKDESS